jgi:hypothetical protein
MSARLAYADHIKVKGTAEDPNAYVEFAQSMVAAIC